MSDDPRGDGVRPASKADLLEMGKLQRARERLEAGLCLVEGAVLLGEALAAGRRVRTLLGTDEQLLRHTELVERASAAGARVLASEAERIARVSGRESEPGLLGAVELPPAWGGDLPRAPEPALVLALCGLQDPGNVGTLLRSARAFGASAALLLPGCADPTGPKVLRASAGAAFRLPLLQRVPEEELLPRAAALGLRAVAAQAPGALAGDARVVSELPRRCLLVLGHETRGVPLALDAVSVAHEPDVESLNVAMAGSILMARWYAGAGRRA